MGKPSAVSTALPPAEYIGGLGASRGTETSQYPEERKSTETPRVVASERGSAQTEQVQASTRCLSGVVGLVPGSCSIRRQLPSQVLVEASGTSHHRGQSSRRRKRTDLPIKFLSRTAPVKRGLNLGGPPSKAKYSLVTDSGLVP